MYYVYSNPFNSLFWLFLLGCLFTFVLVVVVSFILSSTHSHSDYHEMTPKEKTATKINAAIVVTSESMFDKIELDDKLSPQDVLKFAKEDINKRLDDLDKELNDHKPDPAKTKSI
jgi:hypothetical protein